MACNETMDSTARSGSKSFNPWRVFSWLATILKPDKITPDKWFQSLAGFFVACNRLEEAMKATKSNSFNPWRVFSWLATNSSSMVTSSHRSVSIPGGFFRGLQPWVRVVERTADVVSIPGGFFRGLQPSFFAKFSGGNLWFQSLAGFFVACNIT